MLDTVLQSGAVTAQGAIDYPGPEFDGDLLAAIV
jgi:hypothetical protein